MTIRVALSHRTSYRYARLAALSPQVIRLRPAPHNRTPVVGYSLTITPKEHFINWLQDPFGNYLARVVVPEPAAEFCVQVDLVADLTAYNPFDFFLEPDADEFPFDYTPALAEELEPFRAATPPSPTFDRFLRALDKTPRRTVDFLVDTNRAVHRAVEYVIRLEPGVQTPEETLTLGRGSCRDSAWLLVQVLRHLGLASRFVSGYLIQLTPDEKPLEGPPGPSRDFTDLHAWCECYVPGAGWIGLDPTSGLLAAEGHIPLACTPKPSSAAPVEGAVEVVETDFSFEMSVRRLVDRSRTTKPYTEAVWSAIVQAGHEVDNELLAGDVRLTMGGEPTFVGTEAPDAPEWNTEALGHTKAAVGDRLLRALRSQWKPGSLLHHGQGKWYPGEQLPRWALSAYYRVDGGPVWLDDRWLARAGERYGHTAEDAERFAKTLTRRLGLSRHGLMPAFEDTWYYLWRERRLPKNVDPLDSRLDDPLERARLARVFRQGLEAVVGYVLPLAHDGVSWVSGPWSLREERCFLTPGDFPMGFRLPLDALPWVPDSELAGYAAPLDPTVSRPPLPTRVELASGSAGAARQSIRILAQGPTRGMKPRLESRDGAAQNAPFPAQSPNGVVRTALCVEPRDGTLRVFMPPLQALEAYLQLVTALEDVACELGVPVHVEGYPPPSDPRLQSFKVTPDPGVLEVNVPPVRTWGELLSQTAELYHAAREQKISAEKFEIDGRHVGSGGGNHVVLGGCTTLDSPFLRRPDLLRSLLALWNNYPSLSYLFSGQFIGPTSQHPRVDEARHDAIHELELAFRQLSGPGEAVAPWIVDRVLRHLLTDATGNTHRTEFCIDKLYSPDGPAGRLGLLELRCFEMPPHPRMASAQQLLLRTIIAAMWKEPYVRPLVRWGTRLHDRFVLPFFVERDFGGVLEELATRGFAVAMDWFRPHFEFRFPLLGEYARDSIALELRGALEPWHVLGEEATAGGQTRYVDSSVERLQVRVTGIDVDRYAIACGGVALPLHATGTRGEAVCGVRYRAWQPPSCLHPTIGVDGPLHFDIYDLWHERAVGGCTYHVVHPGGRATEARPVNAVAAESRRVARFDAMGHVQGTYPLMRCEVNPEFPMTLDLRRTHLPEFVGTTLSTCQRP